MAESTTPRYRAFRFGVTRATLRHVGDNAYFEADQALEPYSERMSDRLLHWAQQVPERTLYAKRDPALGGDWRHLSFAQALEGARRIGQTLLDLGLSADRPVAILSDNDLEHAQLALACIYVGVPYCSVSPPYATVSQDYDKLRHVLNTLTPGLVFANNGQRYAKAIAATVQPGTVVAITSGANFVDGARTFASLYAEKISPAVDAAQAATGPDTIAKFLFTSGSTKMPKAVINTHRMWCANQQQMRQSMPALAEEPPVMVDWLPWNHTFGGNHNFGLALYNGGTLFIDDGKPVPALIGETLRNLREIAPTVYFNVPTGFEAIALAMQTDDALRKKLLSRVRMFFYAGAALAQPIWDSLHASQEREIGERIVMGTGLGMTESAPFGIFVTSPHVKAGDLGVPAPGLQLKLVPVDGKTEVRYKGPNITPGYWRAPDVTAESFDEEGFFRTGDAVLWIDPNDIHQGLKFDGRIAEDFKLATGTFVSVGPLRAKIIAAGAPYVQDAVITGLNMHEVGAMLLCTSALRGLTTLPADAPLADVVASAAVQQWLQKLLRDLGQHATGSANRIARALILTDPPSIDKGEITDKGSINQRAVLKHRDDLVQALHQGSAPAMVQLEK